MAKSRTTKPDPAKARATKARAEARLARVSTGISGLDTILHGGLIKSRIYIVQGHPGVGKTVLGNQVCFHHAGRKGIALYVTLLAEMHAQAGGQVC